MQPNIPLRITRSALAMILLCGMATAWAGLGQAPAPVAGASPQTVTQPASGLYKIQQTVLETGTTVQEYVAPGGVVFAVSWRGPVLPDFTTLFGAYYADFQREVDAARASGKRGGPLSQDGASLVVQSQGRMRNFFGRAYAPKLVPAGVNIQDVAP